jgi:hypothetical protein
VLHQSVARHHLKSSSNWPLHLRKSLSRHVRYARPCTGYCSYQATSNEKTPLTQRLSLFGTYTLPFKPPRDSCALSQQHCSHQAFGHENQNNLLTKMDAVSSQTRPMSHLLHARAPASKSGTKVHAGTADTARHQTESLARFLGHVNSTPFTRCHFSPLQTASVHCSF